MKLNQINFPISLSYVDHKFGLERKFSTNLYFKCWAHIESFPQVKCLVYIFSVGLTNSEVV